MHTNDISQCPFCAGQPSSTISTSGSNGDNYWVACINCASQGPAAKTADKAIELWNNRHLNLLDGIKHNETPTTEVKHD